MACSTIPKIRTSGIRTSGDHTSEGPPVFTAPTDTFMYIEKCEKRGKLNSGFRYLSVKLQTQNKLNTTA